jgi:Domain of Unknown Function (DUF1080)
MKPILLPLFAFAVGGLAIRGVPTSKSAEHAPDSTPVASNPERSDQAPAKPSPKKDNGIVLFDGSSLKNWKTTNFGGEGDVRVEKGQLILERGSPLTGVTWTGPELPKTNYEVTLEAKLINGSDFFCGIGFRVGKGSASFVAGGWGGGVCGISMLDGDAAADNDTGTIKEFKKDKWYAFCLRVTPEKIEVWLDDAQIVDVQTKDRRIEIHPAMEPSLPFGLACYETKAAYRNVKLRKLD